MYVLQHNNFIFRNIITNTSNGFARIDDEQILSCKLKIAEQGIRFDSRFRKPNQIRFKIQICINYV